MLISVLNAAINWLRLSRERNNLDVKRPQTLILGIANFPGSPECLPIMPKAGCASLSRPTVLEMSKEKSPQMFYYLILYCLSFIDFCDHDKL